MKTGPTKAQTAIIKTLEKKLSSWTKYESYTPDELSDIQSLLVAIEDEFDCINAAAEDRGMIESTDS